MQYAVIQQGYGILGVGSTPAEAAKDARANTEGELVLVDEARAVDGDMTCIRCSQQLYDAVRENGSVAYVYEFDDENSRYPYIDLPPADDDHRPDEAQEWADFDPDC